MIARYDTAAHIDAAGKLVLQDPDDFRRAIKTFGPGLAVTVRVEVRRDLRTRGQLGYYWGALLPALAAATGQDPDDLHSVCKLLFNPITLTLGGIGHTVGGSTRTLTPAQFSTYLDRIRRFAETDLGVTLSDAAAPDPLGGDHEPHVDDPSDPVAARHPRARLDAAPRRGADRRGARPRPPQ